MRNRSDKLPKNKKIIITAVVSAVIMIICFICIERRIRIYSAEMGTYYCRAQLSEVINSSVNDVLRRTGAEYSHMSADIYDENGKFVSSEICAKNVNLIQSSIASEINKNINRLSESEIKVPAGNLSGVYLLNGRGPEIRFRLVPVGNVSTELKSSFESAGINQVCHKISLDITAEVKTVSPSGKETVTVDMNCILAENIIAGEVPQGFIDSQLFR